MNVRKSGLAMWLISFDKARHLPCTYYFSIKALQKALLSTR